MYSISFLQDSGYAVGQRCWTLAVSRCRSQRRLLAERERSRRRELREKPSKRENNEIKQTIKRRQKVARQREELDRAGLVQKLSDSAHSAQFLESAGDQWIKSSRARNVRKLQRARRSDGEWRRGRLDPLQDLSPTQSV